MTGIAAIFSAGPACLHRHGRMMAAMAGRITDTSGTWTSGSFALGAAVLHTTAESFEAVQPHTNEDASLALAMDGYLTNWEELRRDLTERGACLRNRSDAELVLRAYEFWGEDCAARLEGEFAIVIADQRRQQAYLVRDHQGLRPLYIYQDKDALLIASDLAAIIAGCERRPEPNQDYLACLVSDHWYQRDATVWQGVERVPQAHWLAIGRESRKLRRHYDLPEEITIRYRREEDYVDHYRAVLFDAVRRTARSHQPLAIAVSGGLDSSAIYCIAHQLEQQGRLPAPGLQGYTLAGEPGTGAYELPYAQAAADHCGRSLIAAPLFRPELGWFTAQARKNCDVPIPHNGAMSLTLEQTAHANGARALLNGDGGDQWLDGNIEYYSEFAASLDFSGFAAALIRDAGASGWRKTLPLALRVGAGAFVPMALRRAIRRRRRDWLYRNPAALYWMQPAWRERLLAFDRRYFADLPESPRALANWQRLYSPYRAFALDFMQRQRGQTGIETREPMQTRQFIEFCAAAPKWIFRQGGLTKVVHRKAMREILPDQIIDRTTKGEFSAPALSSAMARAIMAHDRGVLDSFCTDEGIRQLTAADHDFDIDLELGWPVWGCYAVAAFYIKPDV
jgi:asparagine synthase (glutamine-hydrolysing)